MRDRPTSVSPIAAQPEQRIVLSPYGSAIGLSRRSGPAGSATPAASALLTPVPAQTSSKVGRWFARLSRLSLW